MIGKKDLKIAGLLAVLIGFSAGFDADADTVHLKNGYVIDGKVVSEKPDMVTIKLPYGNDSFTKIKRKDIVRIIKDGEPVAPEPAVKTGSDIQSVQSGPVSEPASPAPQLSAGEALDFSSLITPEQIDVFKQKLAAQKASPVDEQRWTQLAADAASDNSRQAGSALTQMAALSTPRAYEVFLKHIGDEDYKTRNPAILGLATCREYKGIGVLEKMTLKTQTSSPPKASLAVLVDALEKGGSPSSVSVLAEIAVNGEKPDDRRVAVWSLGKLGYVEAMPVVDQVSKDPNERVRAGAAFAAGWLGTEESKPILIRLLKDSDGEPVREAAKAVEKAPFPEAIPALMIALSDRYAASSACLALGKLKVEKAVPALIKMLNNTNPEFKSVRQQAARGLGMIGDPAAIDPLVSLLADKSGLGHMCAYALSLIVQDGPDSQKPADWIEWAKGR